MGGSWRTRKASADLSIFPKCGSCWVKARIETCNLVNSISQWRTFILVNPASCGVHALSFPLFKVTNFAPFLFEAGIIP